MKKVNIESVYRRLRTMSGSSRSCILFRLAEAGPQDVTKLAKAFKYTLSRTSHQLGILRRAGMVRASRVGRSTVYRIDQLAVVKVMTDVIKIVGQKPKP